MTYVADEQTRERKLRAVESAAASAVGNGCHPDEVRDRVEVGITEAVAMNRRRPGERVPAQPAACAAPGSGKTPALDAWARAVGA